MRVGSLLQHMVSFHLLVVVTTGCVSTPATQTPAPLPVTITPKPTRTLVPTVPTQTPTPAYTPTPTRVLIPPPVPPPLQAAGLEGVTLQALCLKVEQDYHGNRLNEPLEEIIQRIQDFEYDEDRWWQWWDEQQP